ncbi:SGNH/GDSL hydrolase family protein [Candidatus Latescibacterota bacterium]
MTHRLFALIILFCISCSPMNTVLRNELTALRAKDHVIIVMYGDELSWSGNEYDSGNTYGSMLKPRLQEFFGAQVSFINSSREYESFQYASRRVEEDILSFRPDIVLVMLGRIDAFTQGLPLETHRRNVDNFLGALKHENRFVIVLTSPGLRNFAAMDPDDFEWYREYTQVIRTEARAYRYPVIDVEYRIRRVLLRDPVEYISFFSDNVHLSEKGKIFIADYIFQRFVSVMGDSEENLSADAPRSVGQGAVPGREE